MRKQAESDICMHSQDVMLCLPSVGSKKNQHGGPGMYLMMFQRRSLLCAPLIGDNEMLTLERFVVVMYDRSSAECSVDEARLDRFVRKQKPYNNIPPTRAALREHAKRAAYQVGIVWARQVSPNRIWIRLLNGYGASKGRHGRCSGQHYVLLHAASCQELTRCSCKKGCKGRCKCLQLALSCTSLCSCSSEQ